MKMIVGLGNPGPKYLLTRHNIGFMFADFFCRASQETSQVTDFRSEHQAQVARVRDPKEEFLVVKPQTYMNLSGESVRALLDYYKIDIADMVVVHDDIDNEFGHMRFHKNRGAGGHNGIKSINEILGTQDYLRLKLGVGRPPHPQMEVADYILQNFSKEEQTEIPEFLSFGIDALDTYFANGLEKASNQFNKSYKN